MILHSFRQRLYIPGSSLGRIRQAWDGCVGGGLIPSHKCQIRFRDQLDGVLAQILIQQVARRDLHSIFWLGLDRVEIEAELNQADFMTIRRMRTNRERQTATIYDRYHFQKIDCPGTAVRETLLRHSHGRKNGPEPSLPHSSIAYQPRLMPRKSDCCALM
jgi:hypothetical protein